MNCQWGRRVENGQSGLKGDVIGERGPGMKSEIGIKCDVDVSGVVISFDGGGAGACECIVVKDRLVGCGRVRSSMGRVTFRRNIIVFSAL